MTSRGVDVVITLHTCDLRPGMIARLVDHGLGRFLVCRIIRPADNCPNLVYAVDGWLDEPLLIMIPVRLYATPSREWEVVTAASEAL